MSARNLIAVVVVFCALGQALAAGGPKEAATRPANAETVLSQPASEKLLGAEVEAAKFFDLLRSEHRLNLHVNWRALQAAFIEPTTKLTVGAKDITVRRALELGLRDLSGAAGGSDADLLFLVEGGVVVVSSRPDLDRTLKTRVYPVADLILETRRSYTAGPGVPWFNSELVSTMTAPKPQDFHFPDLSTTTTLCKDHGVSPAGEAAYDLCQVLRRQVDRDSWADLEGGGGGKGMVAVRGSNLLVTQSPLNHEKIRDLLTQLRRERASRRIQVGLAVVRTGDPDAVKSLREAVAKGEGLQALIELGEAKGTWRLDRCAIEEGRFGEAVLAASLYGRRAVAAPMKDGNTSVYIPVDDLLLGYEVGMLPKLLEDGRLVASVACASAWVLKDQNPEKGTPASPVGARSRHNTFEFTLAAGQARLFPVTPMEAKDDGVFAVVWWPKK